jgi:hypothetical protein
MIANTNIDARADIAGSITHPSGPAPKWAALINDGLFPMPRRHVCLAVLRTQASIPAEHTLFRDHNSNDDPALANDAMVDLAEGNVFYSEPACADPARGMPAAPAKLAFVVDDRWELVVKLAQTGQSLRDLFALSADVELLRDFESPEDVVVNPTDDANFALGCVYRTRRHVAVLAIKVNRLRFTEKDGVKPHMKGRQIAALVEPNPDQTKVERLTAHGPVAIGLDEEVPVANGDEFKVIRCNVNAGYQAVRLERELALLRERGAQVTLLPDASAVIYHDVPVRAGLPVSTTDILVKVPAGYPGGIIDNAFLPEGSPLLNRTVGAEQHIETLGGRQWKQKSIHPYTGNGVAWNKDVHGFHTYYIEMVSWLHAGQ